MVLNKNVCPVPFDQQPINEYEALKKSSLFTWSSATLDIFARKLIKIFCLSIILSIVCSLITIHSIQISVSIVVDSTIFSLLIIDLLLIRLYLGWSYILKRLSSATIFYEESGWYDGQLWIKSADILTQDRLISVYTVEPLLKRIQKICIFVSLILIIMIYIIITKV